MKHLEYSKALKASRLVSELESINKIHCNIVNQKKEIMTDLILNCKDCRDVSLTSVVIPLDDAKRILQFIEDYYARQQDLKQYEIEKLT